MNWHTMESLCSLILALLTGALAFHALARSYLAMRRLEADRTDPVRLSPAPPYPTRAPAIQSDTKEAA